MIETSNPVFTPPSGPVTGWVDRQVVRATGIPYARAGRFEVPTPVPDRREPLSATEWAPACPQAPVPALAEVLGDDFSERRTDEDCQNLSITAPLGTRPGDGLPVMVWLHGGSYTSGAGDLPVMDPYELVSEQHVIVVTVTYRLGLFGYLGGTAGRPANLGLLDQIEAFRWVQRNIAAFGGDPRRVTAFGQSAGGDAVAHLMAVPDAPALFSRAIIQSAPFGLSHARQRMNAAMSRAASGVTATMTPDAVVAAQPGVAAAGAPFGLKGGMPFGTQYGFDPLPAEDAVETAWSAVAPRIPVLIGRTAEEARLFLPGLPALRRATEVPVIGPVLRRAAVGAVTAIVYGRGARSFARRHARAGGSAHEYVISWAAPGNPLGAAHTIDLPLLFGDEETWRRAALVAGASWAELSAAGRQVRWLWASFARGEELPRRGRIRGTLRYRAR